MNTKNFIIALVVLVITGDLLLNLFATPKPSAKLPPPRIVEASGSRVRGARTNESLARSSEEIKLLEAAREEARGEKDKEVKARKVRPVPAKLDFPPEPQKLAVDDYYKVSRLALGLVGEDHAANEFWSKAINDTSLSPKQRKNLIEDLNEVGFEDPANPTEDELPLIINRLALIEELAPDAIDDTNANAFAEAYKDLLRMYNRMARAQ